MTSTRKLTAIEYPAPSIPARFRLYHGGSAKNGLLVTHDPASGAYLGDFVYFSTVKQYALTYVKRCAHPTRRLFVADVRYIPSGARVMIDDHSGWPAARALHELFNLIDTTWDLRSWAATMEASGVKSLLETRSDWFGRQLPAFAGNLGNLRNLQRTARSAQSSSTVPPHVVDLIRREKKRWFGEAAEQVQLAPLDNEDCCAKHVLSNTVIFLLQEFGSLDVSLQQLQSALLAYRAAWLNKFTTPLSVGNIQAMRELGVAGHQHLGPSQDHINEWQSGGLIVLVPGPIPVLDPRKLARPRARHDQSAQRS